MFYLGSDLALQRLRSKLLHAVESRAGLEPLDLALVELQSREERQ